MWSIFVPGIVVGLPAAEKANALDNPSNLPTPSNPCFLGLDGWNPHKHWVRPTSQPFWPFFA